MPMESWISVVFKIVATLLTLVATVVSEPLPGTDSGQPIPQQGDVPPDNLSVEVTANPTSGRVPLIIEFTATASSPNQSCQLEETSYAWSFGDGTGASRRAVEHRYERAGDFLVMLTVTDSCGNKGSDSTIVHVENLRPVAEMAVHVHNNENSPFTVSFDASGSYDPDQHELDSWEWDFGDGEHAEGVTVSHSYREPGTYTASLVVEDEFGARSDPEAFTVTFQDGSGQPPDPPIENQFCVDNPPPLACMGIGFLASGILHQLIVPSAPPQAFAPKIQPNDIVPWPAAATGLALFPFDQLLVRFDEPIAQAEAQRRIRQAVGGFQSVEVIGYFPPITAYLIRFPAIGNLRLPEDKVNELNRLERLVEGSQSGIQWAVKNYIGRVASVQSGDVDVPKCTDPPSSCPDESAPYAATRLHEAWEQASGRAQTTPIVAVMDAGIYEAHTEFEGVALDGTSYVKMGMADISWDVEAGDGHGTKVAGIIGAQSGRGRMNGVVSGATSGYKLWIYKTFPLADLGEEQRDFFKEARDMLKRMDAENDTSLAQKFDRRLNRAASPISSVLDAIHRAHLVSKDSEQVVVVNLSIEWPDEQSDSQTDTNKDPQKTRQLMEDIQVIYDIFSSYFMHYRDTLLFVSAAGNSGRELRSEEYDHAPGGVDAPNNITVAATNNAGSELWAKSNFGELVDIAAPGHGLWTTSNQQDPGKPETGYSTVSGTSMATPLVSGTAAIVSALNPDLSPTHIREKIVETAQWFPDPRSEEFDLLDAAAAISRVLHELPSSSEGAASASE